jgi:hypothetical protein
LEVNARLAGLARSNVASFSLSHPHLPSLLSVLHCDAREADLSPASVLTLYLSERGNRQLKPRLARHFIARPSSRAASFCFEIPGWRPIRRAKVSGIPLLLYTAESLDEHGRRQAEREREQGKESGRREGERESGGG